MTEPPSPPQEAVDPADEDVFPTLWHRGRRQPSFLGGCIAYAGALAIGSTAWYRPSIEATVIAVMLLLLATALWFHASWVHGPMFVDSVLPARADECAVRVEWRTDQDGRRPAGTGEVRLEAADAVFVRGETYWWDVMLLVGIPLLTSWVMSGRIGAIGFRTIFPMLVSLSALRGFGLPRRRRVESRVAWDGVTRVDVRGALFVVTTTSAAPHDVLRFAARHSTRLRLLRALRARIPERLHEDDRVRAWQAVPARAASLEELDAKVTRLRETRDRQGPWEPDAG